MIKLLIVDDEAIIRTGIRNAIAWEEHGIEVVGESSDGKKALQQVALTQPDIVLTDLRMPIMDGLKLAETLKAVNPRIRVILLTGYNDTEDLVRAIKLGVSDYIFKPANSAEILETVLRVVEAMAAQRRQTEEALLHERFYEDNARLVKDALAARALDGRLTPEKALNRLREYRIPMYWEHSLLVEFRTREAQDYDFLRLLAALFRDKNHACVLLEDATRALVWIEGFTPDLCAEVTALLEGCAEIAPHLRGPAAVCRRPVTEQTLRACHRAAGAAIERGYLTPGARVVAAADEPPSPSPDALQRHCRRLFRAAYTDDRDAMRTALSELKEFLLESRPAEDAFRAIAELAWQLCHPLHDGAPGLRLSDEEPFEDLFAQLNVAAEGGAHAAAPDLFAEVARYVEANINRKISTEDVARALHLSIGHFCRCFKEQTGKSFIDWLHFTRIERAKLLLSNPQLKFYELAGMVGYADYKTFAKYFLRYVGISPRAYRQKLLRE